MTWWWWLSFANPYLPAGSQFLGACLVKAHGVAEAVRVAHVLEINSGGEVQFMKLLADGTDPGEVGGAVANARRMRAVR